MKKIYILLCCLCAAFTGNAQDMLGIRNSNYAGTTGLDLNPVSIVDSRLKFDFNIISLGIVLDNNYLFIPKDSLKFVGVKNIVDKINHKRYLDDYQFNGKGKILYTGFTIQGPSAMINFGKASIALAFNIRAAINFDNINFAQAKFALTDINFPLLETTTNPTAPNGSPNYYSTSPTNSTNNFQAKDFSFHALAWGEWGLTYGQYLVKKNRSAFKAAVTVKMLQGLGAGYTENTDIDFYVHNNPHDTTDVDGHMTAHVNNIDYGRVSYDSYKGQKSYGGFIHGKGFGWNLGFAYELRHKDSNKYMYEMDGETHENPEVNKYKLKIGLSLVDFGKITFDDSYAGVYNVNAHTPGYCDTCNTSVGYASDYKWYRQHFKSQIDFDTTYSKLFFGTNNPNKSRVGDQFSMALPSAISLQVDYNVYKKFYANATIIQHVKHGDHQVIRANMLSFTPRWEGEWFEASVPVSYFNNRDLRLGLAFRIGSIFFGSDKIGSLFGLTDMYGMDIYGGIKFSLVRSKPRDRDGDHVSDAKDKCPDVAGLWQFQGCPDRDGDGVPDAEDACPDEKGVIALHGCPDKDGDGIADKDDDCPDVAGLPQFKGCPDSDGDGIPDKDDRCPSIAGLAIYKGCPDTDGDSIPDPDDECPNKKGLAIFHGCPDTDGDGIPDNKDDCPYEVGPASNKGCPVKIVEAPKEQPVKVELTKEEQEIINTVFSNLQFETGKSIIKPSSFESLDKLVELMKKKSNFKLQIDGHTDNVGQPANNLLLSKNRANSAKKYLTTHGIDAACITSKGYGQKKPVASNATVEGRAKNRRVEFTIVQ